VYEVEVEVGSATGLVENRDSDVGVEIGEVDDVGAAAEGAEGRSASDDLGGGWEREEKGEEKEKQRRGISPRERRVEGQRSHPAAAEFEMTG